MQTLQYIEQNGSKYYSQQSVEQVLSSLYRDISMIKDTLAIKADALSKIEKKQILIDYFGIKKIKKGFTVNDLTIFCTDYNILLTLSNIKGYINRGVLQRNENNKVALQEWLEFLELKFPEWTQNKKAQTLQLGLKSKGNNDESL